MSGSTFDLDEVLREIQSQKQEIRGAAMQRLLFEARKNPRIHPTAREIFRAVLQIPLDGWTTINAARGFELIAGPIEARREWLLLLNDSPPELAADVALSLRDAFYVPALIELLSTRDNLKFRRSVIRALGRLNDPAALKPLIESLNKAELRPHAVDALGDLGDKGAIPFLEPLLTDTTDAWPEDNHGPMLRVCDLAKAAIERLRAA
jgi:hypothetical protein